MILAGDIVPLHDEHLLNQFFRFVSKNYQKVFWIPGNHEYFHRDISSYSESFDLPIYENIALVNNVEKKIGDIRFIFSTLWSNISKGNEKNIEKSIADFACIDNGSNKLNATDYNSLHSTCLGFIAEKVNSRSEKMVVVTHHLPSHLCNSPLHEKSPVNEAFCADLTSFIEECGANFWIYGHSHFNQKPVYLGNTILLTNQLGCVHLNEHTTFKHNAYFSI